VISGLLLLIGYPTKSFTNLDFYLKLVLIALGMVATLRLKTRVFGDPNMSESDMMIQGKALAWASLLFWLGAVTSARMLAYTYTHVSYPY
jgi:hypothetical protein